MILPPESDLTADAQLHLAQLRTNLELAKANALAEAATDCNAARRDARTAYERDCDGAESDYRAGMAKVELQALQARIDTAHRTESED